MRQNILATVILLLAAASSNADLLGRDLNGSPGSFEAYYDTALNITWLANANLADTVDFGLTGINPDGTMTWDKANEWIAAMNTAAYLGYNNWRLPTVTDTGTSGCDYAYTGTDCGYNVDLSTGEMAHMFYSTLGNTGSYNTSGVPTGCSGFSPYCLTNPGPFSNLQPYYYWSGTTYAPSTNLVWSFNFNDGSQYVSNKSDVYYAWAVHSGDIGSAVPVPAAAWLFGGALAGLGALKRRQARP